MDAAQNEIERVGQEVQALRAAAAMLVRDVAEPCWGLAQGLSEIAERLATEAVSRGWRCPVLGSDKYFMAGGCPQCGEPGEVLHVGDFVSGAMLANIVARAKKAAIKEVIAGGERGVRMAHVVAACRAEVAENEELPNTTNPDDWARVSGRRGERIVYLRTLHDARSLAVAD